MDGIDRLAETCIMQADMSIVSEARAAPAILAAHASEPEPHGRGWRARLALEYGADNGETRLLKREHEGPLTVQKALYPEGRSVCHSLILHPPSGIVGGDRLDIGIGVQQGAHALVTMPGATRWYRSEGETAVQTINVRLGRDAVFEWLPPETIMFNNAIAQLRSHITLEAGARYTGWEILCLGRTASGEKFASGSLRQQTTIRIGGELVWDERVRLSGNSPLLHSAVGLGAAPVTATMLAAGMKIPTEVLTRCRGQAVQGGARAGVSAIDTLFVARYVGPSTEQAREYFISLWRELRPIFAGRAAATPRIWNT